MKLGPAMVDVLGLELAAGDVERLRHPQTGAVILFARNYDTPAQLVSLTNAIRALRAPQLLVAVDHEGGRVQRFRKGFTAIPPMASLGKLWDRDPKRARAAAHSCGFVMASELQAHGVDFTFAPVLDIDYGESGVIGDRAFHRDPTAIASLAEALQAGMAAGGMASVGKHFPGHGFVRADSHLQVPIDERTLARITAADLVPFRRLAESGAEVDGLAAVLRLVVDRLERDEGRARHCRFDRQQQAGRDRLAAGLGREARRPQGQARRLSAIE